jgi:dihydroorotate dehydrogenase
MSLYRSLIRPLLFQLDAEQAHQVGLSVATALSKLPLQFLSAAASEPRLAFSRFGIKFSNPFGVAAGLDKDCRAVPFFTALGFGHVEIGSVTFEAQVGNPRPRIFRLREDEAIINRMGFPGEGAEVVGARLKKLHTDHPELIVGANIGKSRSVSIDAALNDYQKSFALLAPYAKYVTLNVSSPNTPELRKLQEPDRLRAIFEGIQSINQNRIPVLVKFAPDLDDADLRAALEVAKLSGAAGIIATNTTTSRQFLRAPDALTKEMGGLSGAPLHNKSLAMVQQLSQWTEGALPIIGVGGVHSLEQALAFFAAGADLVQIYTGIIYDGPGLAKILCKGLLRVLDESGLKDLSELYLLLRQGTSMQMVAS